MSRDLTPRENYMIDQRHFNKNGSHLYDMKWTITYPDAPDREIPSKEDTEIFHRYPSLAITMPDTLKQIVKKIPEDIVKAFDEYVEDLCSQDKLDKPYFTKDDKNNDTVNLWYNGKLDSGFYYSEYNNELMFNYLESLEKPEDILNNKEFTEIIEEER